MVAEKKKEDRYTRLKALTEYGYDIDWDLLRDKHIIIAGVGGIGSIAAEMLTRCGIGKLSLIDKDIIDDVNLNRLCFHPRDLEKSKVEVFVRKLKEINSSVLVQPYHTDIMAEEFEKTFEELITKADLLLMGLDNVPARQHVNVECINNNLHYVDSGASRSGLSGYVHLVIPRVTACYQCTGAIDMATKSQEKVKGEPCAASLPSTIAIIAGMQVQMTLKHLLKFGSIPDYVSYNGIRGEFDISKQPRDPHCYVCGELEPPEIPESDKELLKLIRFPENVYEE